ncbi:MAG: PilZ domain-containing protein [bacterium]|nr:PilZ domain-containing protein [bacterium]
MPASHFLLLVESDPERTESLAAGLVRLGVEPIRVPDLADAVATVKAKEYAIAAILVPSDANGSDLRKALKSMRRREPVMPAMAYGKAPEGKQAAALRDAGVLLALWDDYDEAMLRFQANRLLSGDTQSSARRSRRVPMAAPVRVRVGTREKDGVLYSLSEGGCFIETPRASMDGARLTLHFELEERPYELTGEVVFANVPGNLQRPNLPLGMGVRFDPIPETALGSLEQFIQRRAEALEI